MAARHGKASIAAALAAAALFGLSTPAAKGLLAVADPWLLAGLLYLGAGIGLTCFRLLGRATRHTPKEAPLGRADLPLLAGANLRGGVVGAVLPLFRTADRAASQ